MSRSAWTATRTLASITLALLAAASVNLLLRANVPIVPSNTWAPTGELDVARAGAASTLLYDGRVLITGGTNDDGVLASAERYSPDAQDFIAAAPMGTARANHTATLLPDGRVLAAGGIGSGGAAMASAEVYD